MAGKSGLHSRTRKRKRRKSPRSRGSIGSAIIWVISMGINMLMDTATGWLLYELVEVNDQKKLFLSNYIHMLNNRTAFTKYYNHPLGHLFCPWSSIINRVRGVRRCVMALE